MRTLTLATVLALAFAASAHAGADWKQVEQVLGREAAEQPGGVRRFSLPRSDLKVTVDGIAIKPALALGSWLAFKEMNGGAMVMGDLVLTEPEIGPVMSRLAEGGIEITALHNHLLRARAATFYMHVEGQGKTSGGVYQLSIPRVEMVSVNGMEVPASMGTAIAINFQPIDDGRVATTGDFVLRAEEVNPVLRALREHGLEVTAIHNHMLQDKPRLFFLHFWGVDEAGKLAERRRSGRRSCPSRGARALEFSFRSALVPEMGLPATGRSRPTRARS